MKFKVKQQHFKRWPGLLILLLALLMVFISPTQAQEPGGRRTSIRASSAAANTVLTENFDGTSTPVGWTVQNNVGSAGWSFNNPGGRTNGTGSQGNFAIADSDKAGEGVLMDTELRTPSLNLSGIPTVQLKFQTYYKHYDSSVGDVDVSNDGGATWQNVWRATTDRQGLITLDISAQAANQSNVVIRFRYYEALYTWYWQVDEVLVSGLAGTTAPSNLTTQGLGGNALALEWQDNSDNETAFEIERSTTSGSGFVKRGTTAANETTYFSTGLTCGTTYFYRVRSVNASGASAYSNEANGTTEACAGVSTLNENFDGQTTTPANWSATGWVFDDPFGYGGFIGLTPNFAMAFANAELRTPVLDLSSQSAVSLNFDTWLAFYDDSGSADVDVSTDGGTTWQNVWRNTGSLSGNPLKSQTVDISAKAGGRSNVVIRFLANSTNLVWAVDNVSLGAASAPSAPTGLTATAGNNGVVNLTWANPSGGSIEVQRSEDSVNWATIFQLAAGSTSYVDSNVVSGKSYSYRVRASGTGGTSAFSNVASIQLSGGVKTFDVIISLYYNQAGAQANRTAIENNIKYFADAVYEMSNGAHRIGTVKLYTDYGFRSTADFIWADPAGLDGKGCWPNAYVGGRARETGPQGKRIQHCDKSNIDHITTEAGQRRGGYVMAHEWGHYFYGMYDEYVNSEKACTANIGGSPCATDTAVQYSIMNQQYRAVTDNDLRWLNFSTPQTFNQKNAEYRVFKASAWDVLTRPISQDPPYTWPREVYYPELANVKPGAGQLPSIELPNGQTAARAALNIVWPADNAIVANGGELTAQQAANNTVRQIVIDRSANMSTSQLEDVKNAVNLLIDQAQIGSIFGIFAYGDGAVQQIQTPVTINGAADKTTLKNAVDGIAAPAGNSVTGDALQAAVTDLVNNGPAALNQVVYLISAGPHQTGVHPIDVVTDYQDAFVTLYTFGYGVDDGVATTLEQVAEQTGGFYRFADNRNDLQTALKTADKVASPVAPVYIALDTKIVSANSTDDTTFYVDSTLSGLEVGISYLTPFAGATFSLLDPLDNVISTFPVETCEDWSGYIFDDHTVCFISVGSVDPGTWTLRTEAGAEDVDLLYWMDGIPGVDAPTFSVNVESLSGDIVAYPEPVLVTAAVGTDLPITDINVQGEIYGPGTFDTFTMRDDGVSPDQIAQDGIYSALINYSSNGYHYIYISFDNSADTGKFTNAGLLLSRQFVGPGEDGTYPDVTLTPVGENFQRLGDLQLYVFGVEGDDHSDFIFDESDPPTDLPLDNVNIAGQIDFADDADTFKVTIPDDYEGELVVRVANLGFDMDPYLYFLAEDYSWDLVEYLEFYPTSSDYLHVPLTVGPDVTIKPGTTFFVQVYHWEFEATQGTYTISAGPPISSEQPAADNSDDESKDETPPGDDQNYIYLPLITK